MNTILVPTDFSANSLIALDYAAEVALKSGAKLVILHAVSLPAQTSSMIQASKLRNAMLKNALRDLERSQINLIKRLENQGKTAPEILIDHEFGDVIDHVLSAVEEFSADLIVMGTQGTSNIENVIMGSTASKVIKRANTPVLAVPRDCVYTGIKKIAMATDTPEDESFVFSELVDLARLMEASIELVYVSKEIDAEIENLLTVRREWVKSELGFANLSCHQVTAMDPMEGIVQFIESNEIDLIAMITHKRGFFENLLHTSLTKKMAMNTRVPLLAFQEK